jgi:predicted anti-sigma-YlaC factor YlaD
MEKTPMGSCATIRGMLSGYIEKELSAQDEKLVKDHLAVCSSCSRVFQQTELIKVRLNSMESLELSPAFNEKLRMRITEPAGEESSIFTIKNVSWSLSGVAVVVSAYFIFMLFIPPESTNIQLPAAATPASAPAAVTTSDNKTQVRETIASEIEKAEQMENNLKLPSKGDTATKTAKPADASNINLIEEKK